MLTYNDIKKLVSTQESSNLELKETTGQLSRAMETGCAFLNSDVGGHVLFGVSDRGIIIGQQVSDKTKKTIAEQLRKFEPAAFVDVEYISIPDTQKNVIAIYFDDAFMRKPFIYDGRAYMRVESTTTVMSQDFYNELLINRQKNQYLWEAFTNKSLTVEMLDKEKILGTIRLGVESGRLPESTLENQDVEVLLNKLDLFENGLLKNAAGVLFISK